MAKVRVQFICQAARTGTKHRSKGKYTTPLHLLRWSHNSFRCWNTSNMFINVVTKNWKQISWIMSTAKSAIIEFSQPVWCIFDSWVSKHHEDSTKFRSQPGCSTEKLCEQPDKHGISKNKGVKNAHQIKTCTTSRGSSGRAYWAQS
jgi:hypothetical protein